MTTDVAYHAAENVSDRRSSLLRSLRGQLEDELDRCLPRSGDVAFIDFPLNPNVGNHLMWLAMMRYLHARRRRVGYVAHARNYRYDALKRAIGDGPVLINGGAAVGGLWPLIRGLHHQAITDCRENPVVLLPQTVMFRDDAEREASRGVLDTHPRLTVLVRDSASFRVASAAYKRAVVTLVPDLAFLLRPQRRRRAPEQPMCWLARDDIEAMGTPVAAGIVPFDWAYLPPREWPLSYLLMRLSGVFSRARNRFSEGPVHFASGRALVGLYERISETFLRYGNALADRGAVFVTDRLHGHVLAILRGQPAVLLPDAFGKNRAIYETWTHRFDSVVWADTPSEAVAAAHRLQNT